MRFSFHWRVNCVHIIKKTPLFGYCSLIDVYSFYNFNGNWNIILWIFIKLKFITRTKIWHLFSSALCKNTKQYSVTMNILNQIPVVYVECPISAHWNPCNNLSGHFHGMQQGNNFRPYTYLPVIYIVAVGLPKKSKWQLKFSPTFISDGLCYIKGKQDCYSVVP